MKICILSMQRVQNFGSLLQSYSLKKMLENLGHEVRFIDIERIEEDDALLSQGRQTYSNEGEAGGSIGAQIKKVDRYFINRLLNKKSAQRQREVFNLFRKDWLHIETGDNDGYYDICVIGSDEVFNCLQLTSWGFTSQLFGNVKQADCVITYAASCGSTTYEELPISVKNKIKSAFDNISAFSVRDENTAKFVNSLTDKVCEQHLDPVVVGDFRTEIAECDISSKVPQHYCVIYSYHNRIHSKDEIAKIKAFCKEKGLEPVAVGAPQMWVKKHLVLTPFEVLSVFKNADFIITDTFHGTIFSVKYAKKFATMARPSNRNKLLDLVERLKIENHLISTMDELDRAYSFTKDQMIIDEIVTVQRERTNEYLRKSLQRS